MLILVLVVSALVVLASALFIFHLMVRRRQLAEAQAYARIRALRALGQRMSAESGATSQRYMTTARDKQSERQASSHN